MCIRDRLKEDGNGFLMLIGVDDFREINEKYGIDTGNSLLRELTGIIRECMEPGMMLYRLVADEFVPVSYTHLLGRYRWEG